MALFFSAKQDETIAIVDIGSSSVGVAFAVASTGAKPRILWSAREEMVFQTELNFSRFFSAMTESLDRVLARAVRSGHRVPRTFFVSLASPWYIAQTRHVQVKRLKPFTVTEKGIAKLVEQEVLSFQNYRLPNYRKVVSDETRLLEAQSIQIKLNGYAVTDPYGTSVTGMDMWVYISMSPASVLDSVKNTLSKHVHARTIEFHSFPLLAFSTIRDIFTEANDFLLLDISGEVTDVSIVRDDVLLETISFPLGKNFLIRRIASAHNTSPEEALSLLHLYLEGKADEKTKMQIQTVLLAARVEWLGLFTEALGNFSKELALPHKVFFTADPDVSLWFAKSIQSEGLGNYTFTDEPLGVTIFDATILSGFVSAEKNSDKDPFLLLQAIFAAKSISHR